MTDVVELIDAAGDNPKLKAIVSGAIKGSAFAAGFPLGAGVGAAAGAAIPIAGETPVAHPITGSAGCTHAANVRKQKFPPWAGTWK